MFNKMNTNTELLIVNSSKSTKINYNSRKFKQGLERITQKNLELMKAKIHNPNKMYLTFNPIYKNTSTESTNNLKKIKNYFNNFLFSQ